MTNPYQSPKQHDVRSAKEVRQTEPVEYKGYLLFLSVIVFLHVLSFDFKIEYSIRCLLAFSPYLSLLVAFISDLSGKTNCAYLFFLLTLILIFIRIVF